MVDAFPNFYPRFFFVTYTFSQFHILVETEINNSL